MKTRAAAAILFAAGLLLTAKAAWNLLTYASFQSHPEWFTSSDARGPLPFEARLFRSPVLRGVSDQPSTLRILGRLVAPRIGLSVLVVEGDDEASLSMAAGHLPGTAPLGTQGNSVIAGHRDLTFRPLKDIAVGDRVMVFASKTYSYTVDRIRIVEPDDTSVLNSGRDPVLTLLTCYPFRYAGSAPQRFVVRCRLL